MTARAALPTELDVPAPLTRPLPAAVPPAVRGAGALLRRGLVHFRPDVGGDGGSGGNGGGGSGGSGDGAGKGAGSGAGASEDEIEAEVQRRVDRFGAQKALTLAVQENARLRRQNERRVDVPDGGRVLDKAAADRFAAFEALGKTPDALTKALADGEAAAGTVARYERRESVAKLARDHGWKPDALADLADEFGFAVEVREVSERDAKGAKVKREVLFAVPTADATKAEPVDDLLGAKFRSMRGALDAARLTEAERRAHASGRDGDGDGERARSPYRNGTDRSGDRAGRSGPPTFTRQDTTRDRDEPERAGPAAAVASVLGSVGQTPSERRAAAATGRR